MKKRFEISIMLVILLFAISCSCEKGNGDVTSEKRMVSDFDEITIKGAGNVFLKKGDVCGLEISADKNLLPLIESRMSGDELIIKTKNCIKSYTAFNIYITYNRIEEICLDGNATLKSENIISAKDLLVRLDGSGEIQLQLQVTDLKTKLYGSGVIKLAGKAEEHKIIVDGSGSVKAFDLITEETDLDVKGASSCNIMASKLLKGDVGGSANVIYVGNPSKIKTQTSGAASIKSKQY